MENKIHVLPNRYKENAVWVTETTPNVFELKTSGVLYFNISGTIDDIVAIDPEGGPYIAVGGQLVDNRVIEKITYNEETKTYIINVK